MGNQGSVSDDVDSEGVSDDVGQRYVEVAQQHAVHLQQWRESRIESARLYAESDSIVNGDQSEIQAYLGSEEAELPDDIYRVHVVDTETWTVVASTFEPIGGEPLRTAETLWQNRDSLQYGEDDVFVSVATEAQSRSLVSFVAPVQDGDADTRRAVVVMASADEAASDLSTDPQVFSEVVDSQGRVVTGTREQIRLARNDGRLEPYSATDGINATEVRRGLDGNHGYLEGEPIEVVGEEEPVSSIVAFAPVPGVDWMVVVHGPRDPSE